jgi:hypothetical protein
MDVVHFTCIKMHLSGSVTHAYSPSISVTVYSQNRCLCISDIDLAT